MEDQLPTGQGQISVHVTSTSFSVAPGGSVTLPLFLHNQGAGDGVFELSVGGVPTPWLFIPSPAVRLAPGEQREVPLTIQVPAFPHSRAGRYRLLIRASNQAAPAEAAEVQCTLTVAALEVPGRIGILLPATEFPVAPGEGVTIPLVLLNQGLEGDVFALSVDGIPTAWVFADSASTPLSPGQAQEVSLTIQPPRSLQAGAGRRPFKIQVTIQAAPGQVAEAECTLTIATFTMFSSELRPQQVEAGEPARVMVENRGNIQQAFTLAWQSPDDALTFEPGPTQQLRVRPGEVAIAEFHAAPQKRPFLGKEVTLPYTTRVQAADMETQNLKGEVVARPLLPNWVVPAMLVLIMALACCWALVLFWDRAPEAPTEPPEATEVPTVEAPPEQPTELPPEVPTEAPPEQPTEPPPEVPTEAPPEQPTEPPPEVPTEAPPEQPTEPPPEVPTEAPPEQPTEEPPEAGHLPELPPEEALPCTPLAFGLVLAPLLVAGAKRRKE